MIHLLPQTYLMENHDSESELGQCEVHPPNWNEMCWDDDEGPSVNGVEKRTGEIRDERKANEEGEN